MKIKNVTARQENRKTTMALTGFVEPGVEYIVRETFIGDEPCVIIYQPIIRECVNCHEEFESLDPWSNNVVCERCMPHDEPSEESETPPIKPATAKEIDEKIRGE